MITLYGCFRSRASRPLWLLYETGATFTHVPVIQGYRLADPLAQDAPINTASPEFLAVNPMGQIPALSDGDLVLTESLAMTLYLSRKLGGDTAAKDMAEEAMAMNWAMFAATAIEPHALTVLYNSAGPDAGNADAPQKLAEATAALVRPLARLEQHLSAQDWLMGGRFTVADLMAAECTRYAQPHPPALEPFPAIRAWLARCHARPAFQKMWAGRMSEPA
jgi:glutathione S-transferase